MYLAPICAWRQDGLRRALTEKPAEDRGFEKQVEDLDNRIASHRQSAAIVVQLCTWHGFGNNANGTSVHSESSNQALLPMIKREVQLLLLSL